jgi:3-phenylpropionate/cinnamic acid dioxygenase small subunit
VDSVSLQDRLDVHEVVTRYAYAVDEHDWAAFAGIFADEVHLVVPHVEHEKPVLTRDEIVALIRQTTGGFEATHHLVANQLVTLDGDRARCKAYANAWHHLQTEPGATDYVLVRGYYDLGLERTAAGWRIAEMIITVIGAEGDMGLYDVARTRQKDS